MILAAVVQPSGETDIQSVDPNKLREVVGGWIELIGGDDWYAAVDEEGRLKGLDPNMPGTLMARHFGWSNGEVLVGPVVFFGKRFVGGEDGWAEADLPERIQEWLAL